MIFNFMEIICNLCYNLCNSKTGTYGQKSGTDYGIGSGFLVNNTHEK